MPENGSAVLNEFRAGQRVRLKSNTSRIGVLSGERVDRDRAVRWEVHFPDGSEFVPELALETVSADATNPYALIAACRFGKVSDLRCAVTYFRLSGRLADLIYSLNTTNTDFIPYQFKPVLNFLDSPSRGLLIADEVGLGKTIEAGLIWTELRSRADAQRLLIICPSFLREKWRRELLDKFGIEAIVSSAEDVLTFIEDHLAGRRSSFALIASMEGLRPPVGWDDDAEEERGYAARLGRLFSDRAVDEPIFDLVVIDEAHYMRNAETQNAKLGRLVRPVADNLVLLSATPIQLRSADLFNLLNILDEDSFPFEWSFGEILEAQAPLIALRDHLVAAPMERGKFLEAVKEALAVPMLANSEVLRHIADNVPPAEAFAQISIRLALADQIDRISPLTKVINRTRKRDVHERRVMRQAYAHRAPMTAVEAQFYETVTERVREYCRKFDIREGFLLTIPQRQMCSSMAAACRNWQGRAAPEDGGLDEFAWEAFGSAEVEGKRPSLQPLISELARIAREAGNYERLREEDSKFSTLWDQLSEYWKRFPDRKVVLFSYFRGTLHYLGERFRERGVEPALLMGGMDKDAILAAFESAAGPRILLASEVASEGIDLQFSSLLVNYDLPWNPMKIEQRIGRIDRIGQKADAILIWNMFCADTLDDRVYTRLLSRLNIFERALGGTEGVLGAEIRQMTYELLRHHLTPDQEQAVIEQARIAVENNTRLEDRLEEQATYLVAHGEFIQQKINAARQLNRFITNDDLYAFVRDFFDTHFKGSQFVARGGELLFDVELSLDARMDLEGFLRSQKLEGRTRLAAPEGGKRLCLFENRIQRSRPDREVISQYHPLVRYVSSRLRQEEDKRPAPIAALEISATELTGIAPGWYVYAVQRWALSGERVVERLAFAACTLGPDSELIEPDEAERLVNVSAARGRDRLNAPGEVDGNLAKGMLLQCVESLDDRFKEFVERTERENRDRIALQLEVLAKHEERISENLKFRITAVKARQDRRILPALEGQLRKHQARMGSKRAELQKKLSVQSEPRFVSGGVICVIQ